jgi:DNA-binding transcriptional regulator LsrR (DeoR family)
MGSLTANSAYNPFEVVHALARATGGEGFVLPVPFIADSVEDRVEEECSPTKRGPIPEGTGPG